ncbi:FKBP-type peptidyl-prolyl cis-trans isomerase FklB [Solimonas aquatica]|uniref:Peptidyl-prolyl cis-trans isomerase n=1 Tax=Solimonas aquatica TaxID=489703 RepID=A0A1H9M0E7_9GAMM|nr:FKBP-type peptidyl-prolyl cis-trans isomerase [Solimonas aquatica]SER17150.1 FKBP-type peptidyl-prolyl cis-trans isomerase FklB [Solimonas aquatica]
MNKSFRALLVTLAAAALISACATKEDKAAAGAATGLETDAQKFGYAIGIDLGKSLQPVKEDVDLAALKAGLDDAAAGATPKLDDQAREQIKTTVARKMQERQLKQREEQAVKNKEEGEKFLAENGKREGVKTTASGLQYEVLTEGKGDHPKASDNVTVNYKGTLINGETFDSSYDRGQPVTFPLGNVIPGWTEGVQLMTPGSKYKLYIPSALAYGERGAGVKIGPNQTLIFEVELISVEKAK